MGNGKNGKNSKVLYWAVTLLFVLPAGIGGIVEFCTNGPANIVAIMQHLGYPLYVMKILGFAKALGMIAILTGISPRLKEWAYAGYVIELLGAAASHAYAGDGVEILFPLLMMIPLLISYWLWSGIRLRGLSAS